MLTLRAGDVVVWDNLACHRRAEARAAVAAVGAEVRFLPAHFLTRPEPDRRTRSAS
ncbi:MAG: hypothetical protein U0871_02325 [Gemmataceae bacterium]